MCLSGSRILRLQIPRQLLAYKAWLQRLQKGFKCRAVVCSTMITGFCTMLRRRYECQRSNISLLISSLLTTGIKRCCDKVTSTRDENVRSVLYSWVVLGLYFHSGEKEGPAQVKREFPPGRTCTRCAAIRPLRKASYSHSHGVSNINRAHPKYDYALAHLSHQPEVEVESFRRRFRLSEGVSAHWPAPAPYEPQWQDWRYRQERRKRSSAIQTGATRIAPPQ